MMRTTRGTVRRRVLGIAGVGLGVLALAACNPLEIKATPNAFFSGANYRYINGPDEVWFEVKVRGTGSLRVATRVSVIVSGAPTRTCGDPKIRGKAVECTKYYPGFAHVEPYHRSDRDMPGDFWPTNVIRNGEEIQVHVICFDVEPGDVDRNGPQGVGCPDSTVVEARVVDGTGKLVGELRNASVS